MKHVLTLLFLSLSTTCFCQYLISNGSDETLGKLFSRLIKDTIVTTHGVMDSTKAETSAGLIGYLSHGWGEQKKFPIRYKILEIKVDTVFELPSTIKGLEYYNDTNSVYYSLAKGYARFIDTANVRYAQGLLTKTQYKENIAELTEKRNVELKKIAEEKSKLREKLSYLTSTDILHFLTYHRVSINGAIKKYEVGYFKKEDGNGWQTNGYINEIIE